MKISFFRIIFSDLSLFLFLFICLSFGYVFFIKEKNSEIEKLKFTLAQLDKKKTHLLSQQEDLQLRIQSQNDPAWIELVLMRELGVVPEGYLKVRFHKK